ncbi:MAG: PA2169 family four-helix-bundle protein [Blastocatellia bacterium]|nr:PA2169 family four-helix-bundle protein [Blastocatellia bacterium]
MNIDYETTGTARAEQFSDETAAIEGNDDVISRLNGLIEICKDGQEGFKNAAEGVEDAELKKTFYESSQQRSEFAGILQASVRSLGGDPETKSTVLGSLHRGWMDLKSAVTGKDASSILNECERGEDAAKDAYKDAVEAALPANIADIIAEQAHAVTAAHNRIRSLRDQYNSRSDGF